MGWQNAHYLVNKILPAGSDPARLDYLGGIFVLKEKLKAVGWTVPQSGDGLDYSSNSDILTSCSEVIYDGSLYPGSPRYKDWSNYNSWFVVRMPDSDLEICFWRGTNNVNLMIKIAPLGFNDNTNRSGARPPNAAIFLGQAYASEYCVCGTLPTTRSGGVQTIVNSRFHCMVCDEPINGIYPFFYAQTRSTYEDDALFFFDACIQNPEEDDAPWTMYYMNRGSQIPGSKDILQSPYSAPIGFRGFGTYGAQISRVSYSSPKHYHASVVGVLGVQADSLYRNLPIYLMSSRMTVFKGLSSTFKWKGAARLYPNTLNLNSSLDLNSTYQYYEGPCIYFYDLLVPWPKGETPL